MPRRKCHLTAARLFGRDRAGSETLEWGLLSGLLVAVAIVAVVMLSPKVTSLWHDTNDEIPVTAGGTGGGAGGGGTSGGGGSGTGGGGLPGENTGNPGGVGFGNG